MSPTWYGRWARLPLHPSEATLNAYADAALDAPSGRRIAAHLLSCPRCRATVDGLVRLRTLAATLPDPALPPTLHARLVARQALGDNVILPSGHAEPDVPQPAWRGSRRAFAAAAAVAVAALGTFSLASRDAVATTRTGTLTFVPATPRAGDSVRIEYAAPPMFAQDSLLLARVRMQDRVVRVALRRRGDGRFAGAFLLGRGAAAAFVAVEDERAEQVDSHGRRLWRVEAHDEGGALSYAAALAATEKSPRTTFVQRHAAAQSLVRAFPDSVAAWRALAFLERVVHGVADTAANAVLQAQLERLDARARVTPDPTGDQASQLMWYASTLGDSSRRTFWRARLLRDHPRHSLAIQERAVQAIEKARRATRRPDGWVTALPILEQLWNDGGDVSPTLATFGFQLASDGGDPTALARWGARYVATNPDDPWVAYGVARAFTQRPVLRAEGMHALRRLLAPVDSARDPRRPLTQSVPEYSAASTELRGWVLQRLGEALLAEHRDAEARDTLRLAGANGWNVDRYRSLAVATLRAGDTTAAARAFALVASDPSTARRFADSALLQLGWRAGDARWDRAMHGAADTLVARVRSTSVRLAIAGDSIGLHDARGRRLTFRDVANSKVTVVAFGLTLTERSPVDLTEMAQLSAALQRDGMQLVTLGLYPRPTDAEARLRALGITFPVFFDDAHDAQRAFQAYGFPLYFVVDAAGDVRFAGSEPNQLLLQARASAPRSTVVAQRWRSR